MPCSRVGGTRRAASCTATGSPATGTPAATSESGEVGLAHPLAAEVGEARGVAPRVDVDRAAAPAPPVSVDRRGVGVDDLLPVEVDHEHGGGRVVQHPGEVGGAGEASVEVEVDSSTDTSTDPDSRTRSG